MDVVRVSLVYERGAATRGAVERCLEKVMSHLRAGQLPPPVVDLRGQPEPALAMIDLGAMDFEVSESSAGYDASAGDIIVNLTLTVVGGVATAAAKAALRDLWYRVLHPAVAKGLPEDKKLGPAREPGLEAPTEHERPSYGDEREG